MTPPKHHGGIAVPRINPAIDCHACEPQPAGFNLPQFWHDSSGSGFEIVALGVAARDFSLRPSGYRSSERRKHQSTRRFLDRSISRSRSDSELEKKIPFLSGGVSFFFFFSGAVQREAGGGRGHLFGGFGGRLFFLGVFFWGGGRGDG